MSIRQPKINKKRMMEIYSNMTGEELARNRREFFDEFRRVR